VSESVRAFHPSFTFTYNRTQKLTTMHFRGRPYYYCYFLPSEGG